MFLALNMLFIIRKYFSTDITFIRLRFRLEDLVFALLCPYLTIKKSIFIGKSFRITIIFCNKERSIELFIKIYLNILSRLKLAIYKFCIRNGRICTKQAKSIEIILIISNYFFKFSYFYFSLCSNSLIQLFYSFINF